MILMTEIKYHYTNILGPDSTHIPSLEYDFTSKL